MSVRIVCNRVTDQHGPEPPGTTTRTCVECNNPVKVSPATFAAARALPDASDGAVDAVCTRCHFARAVALPCALPESFAEAAAVLGKPLEEIQRGFDTFRDTVAALVAGDKPLAVAPRLDEYDASVPADPRTCLICGVTVYLTRDTQSHIGSDPITICKPCFDECAPPELVPMVTPEVVRRLSYDVGHALNEREAARIAWGRAQKSKGRA